MRRNGRPREIPRPIPEQRRGFRTAVLLGGAILGGSAAAGTWIGHRRATKRIETAKKAESAAVEMGDFATEYLRRLNNGMPMDHYDKQHFVALVKKKMGGGDKQAEFFWRFIINSKNTYKEGRRVDFYIPAGWGDSASAREGALQTLAYGSAIGLAYGLALFIILNKIITAARFERIRKASQNAIREAMRRMEERRKEQKRRAMEEKAHPAQDNKPVSAFKPAAASESGAAVTDREKELRLALRGICGRALAKVLAPTLLSCVPENSLERIAEGETGLEALLLENKERLDNQLAASGWNVAGILNEIEKRKAGAGIGIPARPGDKEAEGKTPQSHPSPVDKKITKSLEVLRSARENSRGLDRKGLHETIGKAGFDITGAAGGGGHLKIMHEGRQVRNAEGRKVIVPSRSSGDLPYGTVNQILDSLIAYLEGSPSQPHPAQGNGGNNGKNNGVDK